VLDSKAVFFGIVNMEYNNPLKDILHHLFALLVLPPCLKVVFDEGGDDLLYTHQEDL